MCWRIQHLCPTSHFAPHNFCLISRDATPVHWGGLWVLSPSSAHSTAKLSNILSSSSVWRKPLCWQASSSGCALWDRRQGETPQDFPKGETFRFWKGEQVLTMLSIFEIYINLIWPKKWFHGIFQTLVDRELSKPQSRSLPVWGVGVMQEKETKYGGTFDLSFPFEGEGGHFQTFPQYL